MAAGSPDRARLTVLITNIRMDFESGTVIYARDLALELQRRGHEPTVHTWIDGAAGRALREAGVRVVTDAARAPRPDVIHGHHRPTVREAVLCHPEAPALFVCHDHTSIWDSPLVGPSVRRYMGVSEVCVERLLREGAPRDRTKLTLNFVDTTRFVARGPLPTRPRRALVFSNYATDATQLPAIAEACRRRGIELDVVGVKVGNVVRDPERILGEYDLVFAKAKAAMEAMAVGCAVVLCDFAGVGGMVASGSFERLRPLNFGFAALTQPLTAEAIESAIDAYDPVDVIRLRERIRTEAGLGAAVDRLLAEYRAMLAEGVPAPHGLRRATAVLGRGVVAPAELLALRTERRLFGRFDRQQAASPSGRSGRSARLVRSVGKVVRRVGLLH